MKSILLILAMFLTSVSFADDSESEDQDDSWKYNIPDYGTVYESDGDSHTRIGDTIISSDGTTCVTVGNSVFCD